LTFDLIFIGGRGIVVDYRANRQNHSLTEADDRYTHATIVGVSNQHGHVDAAADNNRELNGGQGTTSFGREVESSPHHNSD